MNYDYRLVEFQTRMLKWFSIYKRTFPWRDENISDYNIVIAEVLLQRTKAETINKFYNSFLVKYPNWKAIVDTPLDIIETDLKPIGLFKQRAKRLKSLAIEMFNRDGVLPSKREELANIPMFGQYITNAIELQIFKRNKPLLDVNMARVLERYFGSRKLSDIRYDPYLQSLAHRVVDHVDSKKISWAILDFAALICKSRTPICINCLLSDSCIYYINFVSKSLD